MKQNKLGLSMRPLTEATSKLCKPLLLFILALSSATAFADAGEKVAAKKVVKNTTVAASNAKGSALFCNPLASKCDVSSSEFQAMDDNQKAAITLIDFQQKLTTVVDNIPRAKTEGDGRVNVNFDKVADDFARLFTEFEFTPLFTFGAGEEDKAIDMTYKLRLDPRKSVVNKNGGYAVMVDSVYMVAIHETLKFYEYTQALNRGSLFTKDYDDMEAAITHQQGLFDKWIDWALDFPLNSN